MENTLTADLQERLYTYAQKLAEEEAYTQAAAAAKRLEAAAAFEKLGIPGPQLEDWKYTDMRSVAQLDPLAGAPVIDVSTIDLAPYRIADLDVAELVFVNGRFAPALSREWHTGNQFAGSLATARLQMPELLLAHAGQYARESQEGFTALNGMLAQDGFVIHAGKNEIWDKTVVIYHLATGTQERSWTNTRNLIVAEAGSQLTVIEKYIGLSPVFDNDVLEIALGQQANLQHYKLQTRYGDAWHVGTTRVNQARDSQYYNATISWSGGRVRNNLQAVHTGQNCQTYFYGLYLLDRDHLIDNHTLVDHAMPNCESHELYKGIIGADGKAVFNGKILVRPDAQKTNAYQSNANILLTDSGTVNAKPELEIFADDVKCSHGATTGQLNMDELFYLKARGIAEDKARTILLTAFAGEVVEHIRIPALRDDLLEQLMKELHRLQIEF